jgi:hypothetical protein
MRRIIISFITLYIRLQESDEGVLLKREVFHPYTFTMLISLGRAVEETHMNSHEY